MDTSGQHITADIWLNEPISEQFLSKIDSVINEKFTVVEKSDHFFEPYGQTTIYTLSESHFSIHTYPENNYLSADLYVCSMEYDLYEVIEEITSEVDVKKINRNLVYRGREEQIQNPWSAGGSALYFITIIVSICSIVYELLLAQSLSTTMGNTVLRYNLTIGIYIASLGTGAILYDRYFKKELERSLIKVELLLAAIGGFAPLVVLFSDHVFQSLSMNGTLAYSSWFSQMSIFLINHGLIVLVGIISGFELPLLMDLGKQLGPKGNTKVLGFDYVGTMIGAIVFPVILLPKFGVFSIGYIIGFINILIALFLIFKFKVKGNIYRFLGVGLFLLFGVLIVFNQIVNKWLISTFYLMQ